MYPMMQANWARNEFQYLNLVNKLIWALCLGLLFIIAFTEYFPKTRKMVMEIPDKKLKREGKE